MRKVKVSIVVPCLNVKNYIRECLDSLINQSLKEIEILCVDAFSTDGTREIIEEYQKKDSRVLLLDDDKKSSGYADNLGISKAKGEYVGIVESDDYVEIDMMETLYAKAIEYELDYIKGNFKRFATLNGKRIFFFETTSMKELEISNKVINPADYPRLLIRDGYMWKGIYKKDFIERYDIKLNETKGAAYQDNGFLHQTICQAKRAMYIDDAFYMYRCDNENSSFLNKKGLMMMLEEYRYVDSIMKNILSKDSSFKVAYYKKMFSMLQAQSKKIDLNNSEDLEDVWQGYKTYFIEGIKGNGIRQDEWGTLLFELEWFIDDPIGYVSYLQRKECYLKKRAMDLAVELRGKKVIIVCAGYIGELAYSLFSRDDQIELTAFADNNKKLEGKSKFNLKIISLDEACKSHPDCAFVIANVKYKIQLYDQLQELGINESNIRVINFELNPLLALGM